LIQGCGKYVSLGFCVYTVYQHGFEKKMFVYLLVSTGGNTYVGATKDLEHRLRAHNREISGGAKATSIRVLQGERWERVCHVAGFPDWTSTLQFEWRFKQISRKYPQRMNPLERRIMALRDLLALEKPTTKSIPYSQWPFPPRLVIENNRCVFMKFGMGLELPPCQVSCSMEIGSNSSS